MHMCFDDNVHNFISAFKQPFYATVKYSPVKVLYHIYSEN